MTVSLCGHDTSNYTGNRVWRSMSSSDSRRREVTEQMWYPAEDCSQAVQQRLEKLSRRRLGVGYGEQTVHEMKQKADAFKTPTLLDDVKFVSEAWWSQAMKTCQPAQPACNLSVSVTGVLKKAIRPNPLQCYRKVASYKRGHPSFWTKQLTASPSNSRQGLFLVTLICCNVSLLLCNNVC